jgi:hypothetical protein
MINAGGLYWQAQINEHSSYAGDQLAPGVDLYRNLNMIGLPDRVTVRPGPPGRARRGGGRTRAGRRGRR